MTNTNVSTCERRTPRILQRVSAGAFGAKDTCCESAASMEVERASPRELREDSVPPRMREYLVQTGFWQSVILR